MSYEYNDFATGFLTGIDKYVNRSYLNNDRVFVRKGKLSLADTIKYPLIEGGHTNSREANKYIQLITGDDFALISQQAIGEKRGFINPQVYVDMYKDFVDEFIRLFGENQKYKDHIFLAGDTTVIKVPNVSKCKEEFPVQEGKPARARLSTFADVFSGLVYTAELVEKNTSESKLAVKHLHDINRRMPNQKIAAIYDRGYNVYDLIFNHLHFGIDFLIRLKDDFLEDEIAKLESDDEIIKLYLNKYITNTIEDDEIRKKYEKELSINLRVTKVKVKNKEGKTYTENLLSTLPMDKYSKEELRTLYKYRWEVETDYDRLKNVLELENFTGQRRIIIEQDVFSKIFLLNLCLTIKIDADKDIYEKRKDKNLKYEYQANLNHLLGSLSQFLHKLMITDSEEERAKISNHLIVMANQRLVLKHDKRDKDPKRHKGDITAKHKSNDRRA